jgi:4'-phosphopantetheinyl transferase EntD
LHNRTESLEIRELPLGLLAVLQLPPCDSPRARALFEELLPAERAVVERALPARRLTFAGGRTALRAALAALETPAPDHVAILPDDRGAPIVPVRGVTVSISHTDEVACALVAKIDADHAFGIGLDVEDLDDLPEGAEDIVLTAFEKSHLPGAGSGERLLQLALKISIKEAFYKALDPFVRRTMNWSESEVWPSPDGRVRATMSLTGKEGPFAAEGWWQLDGRRVLASMRVERL